MFVLFWICSGLFKLCQIKSHNRNRTDQGEILLSRVSSEMASASIPGAWEWSWRQTTRVGVTWGWTWKGERNLRLTIQLWAGFCGKEWGFNAFFIASLILRRDREFLPALAHGLCMGEVWKSPRPLHGELHPKSSVLICLQSYRQYIRDPALDVLMHDKDKGLLCWHPSWYDCLP